MSLIPLTLFSLLNVQYRMNDMFSNRNPDDFMRNWLSGLWTTKKKIARAQPARFVVSEVNSDADAMCYQSTVYVQFSESQTKQN